MDNLSDKQENSEDVEHSEFLSHLNRIFKIYKNAANSKNPHAIEDIDGQLMVWAKQEFLKRSKRTKYFPPRDVLGEPCWDIMLDLAVARLTSRKVSVSSCCIASGIAPTTALRWIGHLQSHHLVERSLDDRDKRRSFVSLSDAGLDAMRSYFREVVLAG